MLSLEVAMMVMVMVMVMVTAVRGGLSAGQDCPTINSKPLRTRTTSLAATCENY